jgi:hypothetical protein
MAINAGGIRSSPLHGNLPAASELVAATPLGRDAEGKNLTAYIVRTDGEAPAYSPPPRANNNAPVKTRVQEVAAEETPKQRPAPATNPRFIKPDDLLTRSEKAEVEQLRARDADIRKQSSEGGLLSSYVYGNGPDNRRYILGVSAPLLREDTNKAEAETVSEEEPSNTRSASREKPGLLLPQGSNNPYLQASLAYRANYHQDAAGHKAGLLDQAV